MANLIKQSQEFKALRRRAQECLVAYTDGADLEFTIDRLAVIGKAMSRLLD